MVDPIKCIVKIANKMEISEKIKRHAVNYMHDVITSGIAARKRSYGISGSNFIPIVYPWQ